VIEPITTPERIVEQWADGLKTNAVRINDKLKIRIPDEGSYVSRLAAPASEGFAPLIDPAFVNKSGLHRRDIVARQYIKLRESYENYRRKLEDTFAEKDGVPAKLFKEMVDRSKQLFAKGIARWTLPLTGSGPEDMGPTMIAALWLCGDQNVIQRLRGDDKVLEGGPYLVTEIEETPALKAAFAERITQAGVAILQNGLDPVAMTDHNDRINHLVQRFVNPALGLVPFATGGLSHVDFVRDGHKLSIDLQVSQI
jgi:hypothetical protein